MLCIGDLSRVCPTFAPTVFGISSSSPVTPKAIQQVQKMDGKVKMMLQSKGSTYKKKNPWEKGLFYIISS